MTDPRKYAYEFADFNNLDLRGDGSILWNRRPISARTLVSYARQLAQLNPQPIVWLTYAPKANCQQVDQIRRLLEKLTCPNNVCSGRFYLAEPINPASPQAH